MTAINYSQYCTYRLPCGICSRTNSYCPIFNGTVDITWTPESTGTGVTVNSVATTKDDRKAIDEEIERAWEYAETD